MRLDRYLAEHGHSQSREKAKNEILSGWVKVGGERCHDPAKDVPDGIEIEISRPGGIYVSRGGYKLEKALRVFSINVNGCVALDLGASTGGFTDCLLKNGASFVYAVDVGYGQLDYTLRNDPRVCVYERSNARAMNAQMFSHTITLVVSDLSFISFTKVFPSVKTLFTEAHGVALIKPQFESEPGEHKKGVVRSENSHVEILRRVCDSLYDKGMHMRRLDFSPVKGPKGNIEFLLYYDTFSPAVRIDDSVISLVAANAHKELSGDSSSE